MIVSGRANSAAQEKKPYVIFISADGFRYDLADKWHATNLLALRDKGVAAKSMTPTYPSVTFPNHYSLATGLYASHHGLVDNSFYDEKTGRSYKISDRAAVRDSAYYGGTPIWVLAEQQKMLSACFFWVGSEAPIQGIYSTYYYYFSNKINIEARLKAVKDWLMLPEETRPHLILFYMPEVDHAEHLYGVDSKQAEEAVHFVDDAIGRMTKMVDSLHLPVNYVFVADHGMAAVDTTQGIRLSATIDTGKFVVAGGETMLHLYAKDIKDVDEMYQALKRNAMDYDVFLPGETPGRWHYTHSDDWHRRIGDILLVARYPKVFNRGGNRIIPGMHGFDNAMPQMGATFYAWGPAFKQHLTIPSFENVNVYPLIAKILGLTVPEDIDGSIKVLGGTLR